MFGSIEEKACAKVNLGLRITGRRPDGFHELESVFVPVDLCDSLKFSSADQDSFHCTIPELESADNLVLKARDAFREAAGTRQTMEIRLEKTIPFAAGLGGGSSDAAACLRGMNRIHPDILGPKDLFRLALELGSDVPYFLESGWRHVSGRGEVLQPIEAIFDNPIVVVWPGVGVSTGQAYARLSEVLTRHGGYATFAGFDGFVKPGSDPKTWPENQFEWALFEELPVLRELKQEFSSLGAIHASLSGSGSTVFGIFDTDRQARAAAETLGSRYPRTHLCRPCPMGGQMASRSAS